MTSREDTLVAAIRLRLGILYRTYVKGDPDWRWIKDIAAKLCHDFSELCSMSCMSGSAHYQTYFQCWEMMSNFLEKPSNYNEHYIEQIQGLMTVGLITPSAPRVLGRMK